MNNDKHLPRCLSLAFDCDVPKTTQMKQTH